MCGLATVILLHSPTYLHFSLSYISLPSLDTVVTFSPVDMAGVNVWLKNKP